MSHSPFEIPEIGLLSDLLPAYEFEHLIAHGGMGAVYKARQRSLDRDVAIKILPRELGDDPVFRSSFQAEAKAMAQLAHPNLIRVFDYGDVDGLLYIVMEYVPGKSLHHSAHGKAIEARQAVRIIIAACQGLSHAHENGIVHRDIKPANILLNPKREPKIGDFGLALSTCSDGDGLAMGSPGYTAPEIVHNPGKGSPQADVFAIGIVLRELLTGIPAENPAAAKAIVPDLTLAAICRKATHADPAMRYQDADSLAGQLTRWMTAKPSVALATTRKPSTFRPKPVALAIHGSRTNWELWRNCAVIAFLLCAIHFTWGVYQRKNSDLIRLQLVEDAKPKVIVIRTESHALARLKPSPAISTELAAGNFE